MKTPAPADMQRWSDEVARDPRSLAFLPLARAYRRQGLRDAAMQLCLRGLEAYPTHVEAHGLLALLYLEAGDSQKAADEWSMVLRVDSDNFDALRGLGFCMLEQDHLSRARQMLERAALLRPSDAAVQEALRVLGTRQDLVQHGISRTHHPSGSDDPWAEQSGHVPVATPAAAAPAEGSSAAPAPPPAATPQAAPATPTAPSAAPASRAEPAAAPAPMSTDPTQLFDELLGAGPLVGALLVDGQGLVLAGRLTAAVASDAALIGAVLGGAIGEATRTTQYLSLGAWRGILLESESALLHLAPAGADSVVVLAAARGAPAGWLLRAAAQAAEQSVRFLEEYS
ncbi:MAG TPA: tetratricopeptide repeat protein [Longimicrobiales bacterium]|nr:tetratricopeptide repeat protein [Longimicrobiales bacterium]